MILQTITWLNKVCNSSANIHPADIQKQRSPFCFEVAHISIIGVTQMALNECAFTCNSFYTHRRQSRVVLRNTGIL